MPPVNRDRLQAFVTFCQTYILSQPAATERSNSGPFLEAFFQAFGYAGTKQAGATIEQVVDQGSRKGQTGYADLYWPDGSLLIELKRRSERHLDRHYNQAWGYAQRLTPQPQYIILCNFEQFWIYDLTQSVSIPVERLALDELPFHPEAFRFMERGAAKPKFRDGQIVEVTATAAQRMGLLYRSLCDRRDRLKNPPYTEADAHELLSSVPPQPQRYVIDFHPQSLETAKTYPAIFKQIKNEVLPTRQQAAQAEADRNQAVLKKNPKAKVNHHHQNFLNRWWLLSYPRPEMITKISQGDRYIVCGRVTKRPVFALISSAIRPSDALQVFALDDDYSFGILQSSLHWQWFTRQCSTLKGDFRYTSNTVFDTFPWPQTVTIAQITAVAEAARALRQLRETLMAEAQWSLCDLYKTLDQPGDTPLHRAHAALDRAVAAAYGWDDRTDPLAFLFQLNQTVAAAERSGEPVLGPGLPPWVGDRQPLISADCITS
ncbi:hypothetical protein H6F46_06945 [Limnothrix sp. FACHB-1083]|uniref:type IIL restriction-modification enzyme MmeI n=1 Tax=unclassified Limnothrix TaxID=2632864 RepID=UPI001680E8A0|nr:MULTISPECIES: type IIL restriction-modification enzyme MmeI [unclassified Limnothrix]MBD2160429.1 hypothetical protein [Limnothrix sp. FACHB-1083]MBD2191130.1 hypothetical protein [Limnothrix sp. FACHB-1088]